MADEGALQGKLKILGSGGPKSLLETLVVNSGHRRLPPLAISSHRTKE